MGKELGSAVSRQAARLVVTALGGWLVYLVVANALLWSRALPAIVEQIDPSVTIRYRVAWTVWPTRLEARELQITVTEGDVQARVAFDEAKLDLALRRLASRHVAVEEVRATGGTLRIRRLVAGASSAAPAHSLPGALWTLSVDDAHVSMNAIAIGEARFVGDARLRARFSLSRETWAIDGGRIDLHDGWIDLGEGLVAAGMRGTLTASLAPSRPNIEAVAALRAHLDLTATSLDVSGYAGLLGSDVDVRGGRGSVRVVGGLFDGRLVPGSRAELALDDLTARRGAATLETGSVTAIITSDREGLYLALDGRGTADLAGQVSLDLPRVALTADLPLVGLLEPPGRPRATLEIDATVSTGATIVSRDGRFHLSRGTGELATTFELDRDGIVSGEIQARASELCARWGDTRFDGDLRGRLYLRGDLFEGALHTADGRVAIDGRTHGAGDGSEPWRGAIELQHARADGTEGSARATLELQSLRPLARLALVEDDAMTAALVRLERVRGTISARWKPSGFTLTLLHARSEQASACGRWSFGEEQSRGAALVEIGPSSWGIASSAHGISVARWPGDDWRRRHLEPRTHDDDQRFVAFEGGSP